MRWQLFTVLCAVTLLAGCASEPSKPYWQDPQWVNSLGKTIQENIKYPEVVLKDASNNEYFVSGNAIVQFIYDKGKLNSVEIIKSTGYKVLDDSISDQIPHIRPPLARGPNTDLPHSFRLPVSIGPSDIPLFKNIRNELQRHTSYPSSAMQNGDQGLVLAGFKYRNGQISDPYIVKSSGHSELNQSVLNELNHIELPSPPAWLTDHTFNLTTSFCFAYRYGTCQGQILVVRYQINREVDKSPAAEVCAIVGFNYINGKVSDVELMKSSGYPALDKKGLSVVSQGKFSIPTAKVVVASKKYEIPICEKYDKD